MDNGRQIVYTFLAFVALGFSGWLYLHFQNPDYNGTKDNTPDSIVYNIHISHFDETGKLAIKINSPQLIHYKRDDQSYFTKPRITIFNTKKAPWFISSEKGEAINGDSRVTLINNVNLHQPASSNNQATTILTNRLNFVPKQEVANTAEKIQLFQPGVMIKSVGMHADLKKSKVKLLSKVQARFMNTKEWLR